MLFLRAVPFTVAGVVVGGAAAGAVVLTCNAVNNSPPDWTIITGIAVLVLGPVAGGIAGLVVALRTGRGR